MRKRFFILIFFLIGVQVYQLYPEASLDTSKKIDKILVVKHKRELYLLSNGKIVKKYKISLGREPIGKKHFEGDKKTPEGIYYINDKNPNSGYHLNLGISYPNREDRAYAKAHGKEPGGLIKIHGFPNNSPFHLLGKFHRLFDWTLGCIALMDHELDEIYRNVPIGTEIEIRK